MRLYHYLRKRGLALFMALVMCLSLLPAQAMAGELETTPPADGIKPKVTYADLDRTKATITYTRNGEYRYKNIHPIFLIDVSVSNQDAAGIMGQVMSKDGESNEAFLTSDLSGTVIPYNMSAVPYEVGGSNHRDLSLNVVGGQSDAANALAKTIEVINGLANKELKDGEERETPVVFWVPSPSLDNDTGHEGHTVGEMLAKLQLALVNTTGGKMVVWQKAEAPSEVLKDVSQKNVATDDFAVKVKDSLQRVFCDWCEDVTIRLPLEGTVAEAITEAKAEVFRWGAGGEKVIEFSRDLAEGVQETDVSIPKLYNHDTLRLTVTVTLNDKNICETVLRPTAVSAAVTGGSQPPVFQPAEADHKLRTLIFADVDGMEQVSKLPDQMVYLPDLSDRNTSEKTFGGWRITGEGVATQDNAGNAYIRMPERDATATALWGKVSVELQIGEVGIPETSGNVMMQEYLYSPKKGLNAALEKWNAEYKSLIKTVTFADEYVTYGPHPDNCPCEKDETYHISYRGADYAVKVGKTSGDIVVAYLNQRGDGFYDLTIAGQGGVKAGGSLWRLFSGWSALESADLSHLDTSDVAIMDTMFSGCSSLKSLDVSRLNTSNVTTMAYMFHGCTSLTTLDVSKWDVSKVQSMNGMFQSCGALKTLDVSNWNTGSLQTPSAMFYGCGALEELGVSNWDTHSFTSIAYMFCYCRNLKKVDVSNWDTSNVTSMCEFASWSGITDLGEGNVSNWNTSNVTDMSVTFGGVGVETLDVSNWDTSKVTRMNSTFSSCKNLRTLDVSGWNTSNVTDMANMFSRCHNLTDLSLSGWDTSNVLSMNCMFLECFKLSSLDLSTWDTSNVTNMSLMFWHCSNLASIKLGDQFILGSKITNTEQMFCGCSNLVIDGKIHLNEGDYPDLASMRYMFYGCSALKEVPFEHVSSAVSFPNLASTERMFMNCQSLPEINLSWWTDLQNLGDVTAMFKTESVNSNGASNINIAWSGLGSTSNDILCDSIINGRPVTLEVGDYRNQGERHAALMGKIIDSFIAVYNSSPNSRNRLTITSDGTTIYTNGAWVDDYAPITDENGDKIDDKYQRTVTYNVAAGTWEDGTTESKTEVVTLYLNDEPSVEGTATLTQIPAVNVGTGENPLTGTWNPDPTEVTITKTEPADLTFTYTYNTTEQEDTGSEDEPDADEPSDENPGTEEQPATCAVTFAVVNGTWVDGTETTRTVTLVAGEDGTSSATLTEIPVAAPDEGYAAPGTWSTSDETKGTISAEGLSAMVYGDVTFTCTFAQLTQPEETTPKAPENPDTPSNPDIPTTPDTPKNPDIPDTPDNQEKQEGQETQNSNQESPDQSIAATARTFSSFSDVNMLADGGYATEDQLFPHGYDTPISTAETAIKVGQTFRYRVLVSYTGGDGAVSGQINVRLPLPEGVEFVYGDNPEDEEIGYTLTGDGLASTDYSQFLVGEGFRREGNVLVGAVKDIPAGGCVEISVKCRIWKLVEETKTVDPSTGGASWRWDGLASAQTGQQTAESNLLRLWYGEPPAADVSVKYVYTGDVPTGVTEPVDNNLYKHGATITLPAVESVTGYSYSWSYNGQVVSSSITAPDDVNTKLIYVHCNWTRTTSSNRVSIQYEFTNKPLPAPVAALNLNLPGANVDVGTMVLITSLPKDAASYYDFSDWTAKVQINGRDASDRYTVPCEGKLYTSMFEKEKEPVFITYVGTWEPHTGTIHYDANGGEGTIPDQKVTIDPSDEEILSATEPTWTGHEFQGWSRSQSAATNLLHYGDSVENLVTEKDGSVTLYAIWKQTLYPYTVEFYYDDVKDASQTKPGEPGLELGATADYKVAEPTVEYGGTHFALEKVESCTITENTAANVVKVYYAKDEIGPKDGTPDIYQVQINYKSGNEQKGTVSPSSEVLNLFDGTYTPGVVPDPIKSDVTLTGSNVTVTKGNAFTHWIEPASADDNTPRTGVTEDKSLNKDDLNGTSLTNRQLTGVTGGKSYTYTASFVQQHTVKVTVNNGTATIKDGDTIVASGTNSYSFQVNSGKAGLVVTDFAAGNKMALDTATADGKDIFGDVKGGTYTIPEVTADVNIVVTYSADDNGDEVPDKYQVDVTFEAEHGNFGDSKNKLVKSITEKVTLRDENGRYAENGTATLGLASTKEADREKNVEYVIPAYGYHPDTGYQKAPDNASYWSWNKDVEDPEKVTTSTTASKNCTLFTYEYPAKDDTKYTIKYHFTDQKGKSVEVTTTEPSLPQSGTGKTGDKKLFEFSRKVKSGSNNFLLTDIKITDKNGELGPVDEKLLKKADTQWSYTYTITPEAKVVLHVYYALNNWGPNGPDDTPDSQQVLVKYVPSANVKDTEKVTVEPTTAVVKTLEDGKYTGTVELTGKASAEKDSGFAFDNWTSTKNGDAVPGKIEAADLKEQTIKVEGGDAYIYTANFLEVMDITVADEKDAEVENGNVEVYYDGRPHHFTVKVNNPATGATVEYYTDNTYGTKVEAWPTNATEGTEIFYKVTAEGYADVTGSATIVIKPVPLALTAASQEKTYDGTAFTDADLAEDTEPYTLTVGEKEEAIGESAMNAAKAFIDTLKKDGKVKVNYSENKNAGTYTGAIVPSIAEADLTGNYTLSEPKNGTLTINQAIITVTANNQSKTYDGTAFTGFTYSASGFVNGENWTTAGVAGSVTYTGSAVGAVNAGTYTITPDVSSLSAANYRFMAEDGTLTINAQPDIPTPPPPTPPTPVNPTPTPTPGGTTITDENVPLAGAVGLNDTDHFAYIAGYEDDTVRPTKNITRAEVATIFFRLMTEEFRAANWATENTLKDVQAGDWYNNAVSTCANAGIITGYTDGRFQPQKDITRAEFAVIAARFLGPDADDEGVGDFSDTADHWAAAEIRKAAKAGWITGDGNRFRPNDPITRAEVMVIVNRMLDRTPDAEHMLPDMKTWIDNPEGTWYYEAVQEATNGHDYERDELNVETWTAIQTEKNWKAIEAEWAANNGASAPKADAEPVEADGETK